MATPLTTVALVLAHFDGNSDHMNWDNGWWIVMMIAMLLISVLVIAAVVWLARGGAGTTWGRSRQRVGALEVLDRRLAEGQISVEEYEERRRVLDADSGA